MSDVNVEPLRRSPETNHIECRLQLKRKKRKDISGRIAPTVLTRVGNSGPRRLTGSRGGVGRRLLNVWASDALRVTGHLP